MQFKIRAVSVPYIRGTTSSAHEDAWKIQSLDEILLWLENQADPGEVVHIEEVECRAPHARHMAWVFDVCATDTHVNTLAAVHEASGMETITYYELRKYPVVYQQNRVADEAGIRFLSIRTLNVLLT